MRRLTTLCFVLLAAGVQIGGAAHAGEPGWTAFDIHQHTYFTDGRRTLPATGSLDAWKFGIIGDTQWTQAEKPGNEKGVAGRIIEAVNKRFIEAGVEFVLQVGDLCNNGGDGLNQRDLKNAALRAAGIEFYPVRGNHESSANDARIFNNVWPELMQFSTPALGADGYAAKGLTYAFVRNDVKFVLVDTFVMPNNKVYTLTDYQPWINAEFSAPDHSQVFLLTHKNLLGQSHKDNVFGISNDSNPAMQNAFIGSLAQYGALYLSGHDHMHHRSLVTSPDGKSVAQQIICQSDSSKWYTPKSPFSTREQPIAQELYQIGYYIYNISGPRVTVEYWSTPYDPNTSDIPENPVWTLRETFGYSLNGKQWVVPNGGTYAGIEHTILPDLDYIGTTAKLLAGTNSTSMQTYDGRKAVDTVNLGWSFEAGQGRDFFSDTLTIWGMADALGSPKTDTYALSLTFDSSGLNEEQLKSGRVVLATRDSSGRWIKAVDANFGGTPVFVYGPWQQGDALGKYGIDADTDTAWAVLNNNGDFVVTFVPPACRGDANCDGQINFADINAFVEVLGGGKPCRFENCEMNGDGEINFADINPFVEALGIGGNCP